jgi:glutathione S-transferase
MTYTLYYAPGTASLAVHWMLLEIGAPHQLERLDFAAGEQKSARYLKLNPLGRVPTLIIDGEAYSESAALLMLLADRHPEAGFAPAAGAPGRARWVETMVWLANNLSPPFRDWFYAETDGEPAGASAVKALAGRRIGQAWDRLDGILADGRPCLLGEDVSSADLMATMLMRWSRNMPRPATDWPRLGPFVRRMRGRPAFIELCRREGLTEWLNDS